MENGEWGGSTAQSGMALIVVLCLLHCEGMDWTCGGV